MNANNSQEGIPSSSQPEQFEAEPDCLAERIGDLFPADDPLSGTVIRLALIANDLRLTHKWMLEGPYSPGVAGEAQRLYCYALALSQSREAAKAVDRELSLEHTLIACLPPMMQQEFTVIQESCKPSRTSFVEGTLGPVRNVIFHYTAERPTDRDAWAQALRDVANEPCLIHEGPYHLEHRWLFADAVRGRLIARLPGQDFTQFGADAQRLQELVLSLIRLCDAIVEEHVYRMQNGTVPASE